MAELLPGLANEEYRYYIHFLIDIPEDKALVLITEVTDIKNEVQGELNDEVESCLNGKN